MKRRFVYFLKLLASIGLTAYLSSSRVLKAQNDSKAIEIIDKGGKPTILYESSHALVIWVGNYQHWSQLNNVEAEAKQVKNTLEQRGFKVTLVGNPTGSELRNAIKDFIDNYGYNPDNRLVIFFTGHGHTRKQTKGYLVPVDAPDPYIDEPSFLRYAFPMQQMMFWARQIEAKHALFVFDSCFSGTVFKTKAPPRPGDAYIRDVIAKPVRQFITAGDADQEVPAKSIFTPLFIRGLEGEADYNKDGYVTGSELGLYLTQTLREYTSDQTPQYGKIRDVDLDRGDIVFRSLAKPISSSSLERVPEITPEESDSKSSLTITPSESSLPIAFVGIPRLIDSVTTQKEIKTPSTYYFTIDVPDNAGIFLKKIQFTQTSGSDFLGENIRKTTGFEGTRKNRGTEFPVSLVENNKDSRTMIVSLEQPIPPGKTITIALRTNRTPINSGIYQLRVIGFPDGENVRDASLGLARFHFYSSW